MSPLTGLVTLFTSGFGSGVGWIETIKLATPLLIIAIGLSVPFTAKFWNIGGQGQFIFGEIFATWTGLMLAPSFPPAVVILISLAMGFIGGAIWAIPPTLMKLYAGTNEIITTLMMNFVAVYVLSYLLIGPMQGAQAKLVDAPASNPIPSADMLPKLIPSLDLTAGIIVALVLAVVFFIILQYTNFGYELKIIGSSESGAKYAGINSKRDILLSMVISGGIAGIAGMVMVFGTTQLLIPQFFSDIATSYGYVGIPVALVASLNPIAIIASAIFLAGILNGAYVMEAIYSVPIDVVIAIYGIIMLFSMIGVMTDVFDRLKRWLK
ncbi:MAG: ABC transporter permease [Nitrososphaerota archaeon]|nr:ABC transporter permease [Nitrososphaerota archaeon]MDG6930230.1 ABC transporter permease [Nitrososphaerota archaeon]MDG6932646.1 ABC transporter permease [Nitrososphaerota archaeon]MDG6935562.1 ABC transporter permease [Nitrososphaerota archaeon]MDG6944006.1 ABC transporter permease [Nitrososphaerota archaeon]